LVCALALSPLRFRPLRDKNQLKISNWFPQILDLASAAQAAIG
jgi:hypothetical protein